LAGFLVYAAIRKFRAPDMLDRLAAHDAVAVVEAAAIGIEHLKISIIR